MSPRPHLSMAISRLVSFALLILGASRTNAQVLDLRDVHVPASDGTELETRGIAVVVGVNTFRAYEALPALAFAVKDAEDVAAWLRSQGWTVILLRSTDADAALRPDTKANVLRHVGDAARIAGRNDRFVSSHGFRVGEENYLCVSDTEDEGDTRNAISERELVDTLAESRAVKRALIFDTCRSTPGGRGRGTGLAMKQFAEARGSWHLYATAPGFQSYEPVQGMKLDGVEVENGFFTHFLLQGLNGAADDNGDGFVTLIEAARFAWTEMEFASFERKIRVQRPYLLWDGEIGGDFLLGRVAHDALQLSFEVPPTGTSIVRGQEIVLRGKVEGGAGTARVTIELPVAVRDGEWEVRLRVPDGLENLPVAVNARDAAGRVSQRLERTLPIKDGGGAAVVDEAGAKRSSEPASIAGGVRRLVLAESVEVPLLPVAAGTFLMGSPKDSPHAGNEPQHEVKITRAFWMWSTEVTQAQWTAVMETTPWKGLGGVREGNDQPATYVSWNDAVEFCELLTQKEREAGRLPEGMVYRLPTEAEWEYACRAGTRFDYSFGRGASRLGHYAWFWDNVIVEGIDHPRPVAGKKPNPWGFFDMHGNVLEWCYDGYSFYDGDAVDPRIEAGLERVIRGGAFDAPADQLRSAFRYPLANTSLVGTLGFRPVLAANFSER